MRIIFTSLLSTIALYSTGQVDSVVLFEKELSWQGALTKAKLENKYLFVDCMATWCKPCKTMDNEVYKDSNLTNYMKSQFIAVKVQMDSTAEDDSLVQTWRQDAQFIMKEYKIIAMPTLLFFSPNGELVHKFIGGVGLSDFKRILGEATNQRTQYYTLLKDYQAGRKNYEVMPYIVRNAKLLKENTVAKKVAMDYIDNYLSKLPDDSLTTPSNLYFVSPFVSTQNARIFKLFYPHPEKIDHLLNRNGYGQSIVDQAITNELINPKLYDSTGKMQTQFVDRDPDWVSIERNISENYNIAYAERTIAVAMVSWYNRQMQWNKQAVAIFNAFDKIGIPNLSIIQVNNFCWYEIFAKVNDKEILKKAAKYMKQSIDADVRNYSSGHLDTYANLLYKAGKVSEALEWEEKAVSLEIKEALDGRRTPDDQYEKILSKMRNGEPTWMNLN